MANNNGRAHIPYGWPEDPYEGYCLRRDEEECEDEPRSLYEKYPMDSSYYEDGGGWWARVLLFSG